MASGYLLACLCSAFLWKSGARRILMFLLIAMGVTWAQMAITNGAGGSAHHVILMWPLPLAFVGVAFSAAAGISIRSQ